MVGTIQQTGRMNAYYCRFCEHWHIGREQSENRESRFFPGIGRVMIKRFA